MAKHKRTLARIATGLVWRGSIMGLFILVAGTLVFFALGYRINFANRALEQIGAINITGDVSGASVFLNGAQVGSKVPYLVSALIPNSSYTVRVTKDGYVPFEQSVMVDSGLVSTLGPIDLWLEKPVVARATDTSGLNSCRDKKPLRAEAITVHGGEIRAGSKLVTRFSTPIADACYVREENHIVYASDKAIFIIDINSRTITSIFSSDQTIINLDVDRVGKVVYVQFSDKSWKQITVAGD